MTEQGKFRFACLVFVIALLSIMIGVALAKTTDKAERLSALIHARQKAMQQSGR